MKKAFDQTFRDFKREVNKKVLKVSSIEQKTLDATSNEPWGPQGSVLAEISQATSNYHDYQLIMAVLWKRMQDTGKNWRHVYKALSLLEYLVVHGSERVIDDTREHAYQISALSEFLYNDSNGRDQGSNVRRKSQSLVTLVNNKEKLQEVRKKALSRRDKNHSTSSAGASRPPLYSSVRHDDEQSEGHDGNRDDGYTREKDGDTYHRGYKYTQEVDQYCKDIDVQYSRDDSYRACVNGDYQYRSSSRSVDGYSDRSYEDDRCSTQSIEHKLSADSIEAPPSFEETTRGSCTDVQDDKDTVIVTASLPNTSSPSAPKETSLKDTNQAIDHNLPGEPDPTHDKEVDCFEGFDPRGSVSAAVPASTTCLEFDIFGFSAGDSTNITAPLPMTTTTTTTTSEVFMLANSGTIFEPASLSPNEPDGNPFGDAPFKAVPQEDLPSHLQKSASDTSSQASSGFVNGADIYLSEDTKMKAAQSYDFGDTLGGLSYAPCAANGPHSQTNPELHASEISAAHASNDILDGILPRNGHMVSVSSQESTPEPEFSGYAASHAQQNPLKAGSEDMQIGQTNPFEQPGLSIHLGSQADSFSCSSFQPTPAEWKAVQMNSLEQFGFSETQMQGAPVFSQTAQSRNSNMIHTYASEHPGMLTPLAQVAPVSIQASQSVSPNKTQAAQMNYKEEQRLSSPQTFQDTPVALHVNQSAVPASQGAQWNQLQQPALSASIPSQTTPDSSYEFPPASTNEMQVDQMNGLNQAVLSAPQTSLMYSGLSQAAQATVPAYLHGAQLNPLQQTSLSAPPAQAAPLSSQAFHSEASPNKPSTQRNLLQQPLMSAPQSSIQVTVSSQALQSSAPANMQGFQVNPSEQRGLPGPLTSQATVASSQHFQPVDPTIIHTPQVYPLLQGHCAQTASQNILASQAPSNIQPGRLSFTPQSAVPDLLVSSQPPTRSQPSKDKFEPKSAVWADTISRGLVNLNISGPKINALADIGIDFDDINRKEKRSEVNSSHAPAKSTTTMGRAMGAGSGLGRAGPSAFAPSINSTMGSNMGMGMRDGMGMGAPGMGAPSMGIGSVGMNMGMGGGGGFGMGMGMGGYSGNMYQPSSGMGMGMGMGMNMGMNTGIGMLPPGVPQQGHGMPGAYNARNTGGYGQQQPYGGAGYK